MKRSKQTWRREVNDAVRSALESTGSADATRISMELMAHHGTGHTIPDFHQHYTYEGVRDDALRAIRIYRPSRDAEAPEDLGQRWLPGFDHVQVAYVIEKNEPAVPLWETTRDQRLAKAAEYRRTAETLMAHATELENITEADIERARRQAVNLRAENLRLQGGRLLAHAQELTEITPEDLAGI